MERESICSSLVFGQNTGNRSDWAETDSDLQSYSFARGFDRFPNFENFDSWDDLGWCSALVPFVQQ